MKIYIVAACVTLIAFTILGGDTEDAEARRARFHERHLQAYRSTGGRIVKPGSQKGTVRFVTSVDSVNKAILEQQYKQFERKCPIDIQTIEGNAVTIEKALKEKQRLGFNLVVFICDIQHSFPMMVVPEEGWAIVNHRVCVTPERTAKQAVKAFAYIAGAVNSTYGISFLSSLEPKELDSIDKISFPVDRIETMKKQLEFLGITPKQTSVYLDACQEGWAPAPTNDVQKAIWDKVHAPPSKPLKITYDKAAQKPVVK